MECSTRSDGAARRYLVSVCAGRRLLIEQINTASRSIESRAAQFRVPFNLVVTRIQPTTKPVDKKINRHVPAWTAEAAWFSQIYISRRTIGRPCKHRRVPFNLQKCFISKRPSKKIFSSSHLLDTFSALVFATPSWDSSTPKKLPSIAPESFIHETRGRWEFP